MLTEPLPIPISINIRAYRTDCPVAVGLGNAVQLPSGLFRRGLCEGQQPGRPAIALVNKEDKPTRFDAELIAPYFAMVLPVCCQEEGARKVIAAAVARLLGTNQIDPHAASLSGQRQLSAATRARDAVAGGLDAAQGLGLDAVSVCVDDALDALCELTGENASEAVINEVFEKFCVGK